MRRQPVIVHTPAYARPLEVRTRIARDLEAVGLKATRQRMVVAEVLLAGPRHMTAEQILDELEQVGLRVSKATVYNTLKALTEHGLVRQINLGDGHSVYDSTTTPHHHFHHLDTGELTDIPPDQIAFSRLPALPSDSEATSVEVVIRVRRPKR